MPNAPAANPTAQRNGCANATRIPASSARTIGFKPGSEASQAAAPGLRRALSHVQGVRQGGRPVGHPAVLEELLEDAGSRFPCGDVEGVPARVGRGVRERAVVQGFMIGSVTCVITAMLLGITAGDFETLRRAGYGWRELIEVHNVGALSAWGSTLILAVGAATTTIVSSGIGELVTAGLHYAGLIPNAPVGK